MENKIDEETQKIGKNKQEGEGKMINKINKIQKKK